MREIKFRAWDEGLKRMEPWGIVRGTPLGFIEGRGIILMQYTGLEDTKAKEMYHFDLIQVDTSFGDIVYVVDWSDELAVWVARFPYEHGGDRVALLADINKPFVVGNVYENPELIERAKL